MTVNQYIRKHTMWTAAERKAAREAWAAATEEAKKIQQPKDANGN